jgi:transposase
LNGPLTPEYDDYLLERQLFPPTPLIAKVDRPLPAWNAASRELGRKGVTLFLLWHEYKQAHLVG